MKKGTRLVITSLMLVLGLAAGLQAQDPVKVTFRVNTSTVPDTMRTTDVIQIRGVVNGMEGEYNGTVLNWGSGSEAFGEYEANEVWTISFDMNPGDTLTYKFFAGYRDASDAIQGYFNNGWENDAPGGGNRQFILPEDVTEDYDVPVTWFNHSSVFGAAKADTVQVHFRVNVAKAVQDGAFDPGNETMFISMRGGAPVPGDWGSSGVQFTKDANQPTGVHYHFYSAVVPFAVADLPENNQIMYKFVIERGDGVTWEDTPDRPLVIDPSESFQTVRWKYFNDAPPSDAPRLDNTTFRFAIQVGALEELGYFQQELGDSVFVAGDLTDWAGDSPVANDIRPKIGHPSGRMTFQASIGAWTLNLPRTNIEIGSVRRYKYYIQFDRSRFTNDPSNPYYKAGAYLPGIIGDTGYEEPGKTGGGDRLYTVVDSPEQNTFGNEVGDIDYFNGVPSHGFINEANTAGGSMTLRFSIDMNPAKTNTQVARPFNPAADSVFIVFETNFFAFTQGIRPNDQSIIGVMSETDPSQNYMPTKAEIEKLMFTDPDGDGIYTLDYELVLPTLNDIGFRVLYGAPLSDRDNVVLHSGGTSPGRRYYQFVRPSLVGGELLWPSMYTFPQLTWAADNLPFETGVNYQSILNSNENDRSDLPEGYALAQNFPNPFNPSTTINFTLPTASDVRLTVYNTLGQKVFTVVNNQRFASGTHSVNFDASRLSSGVYIYRLEANNFKADRKMTLIK